MLKKNRPKGGRPNKYFPECAKKIENDLKEQYEIEDELILFRETDENGKNKAFINGRAAPVNKLKDVSESLIDIHGQHENQFLFNPARHLTFIDFFVEESLKNQYEKSYKAYKEKQDNLEDIKLLLALCLL